MKTQLTQGLKRRLMYIENKDGLILDSDARIGWVTFSKTGQTIYYAGKSFLKANGVSGNFVDLETHEEYWISGVKTRGLMSTTLNRLPSLSMTTHVRPMRNSALNICKALTGAA